MLGQLDVRAATAPNAAALPGSFNGDFFFRVADVVSCRKFLLGPEWWERYFFGGGLGGELAFNRLFPPTFYPTINHGLSGTRIYSVNEIPKKRQGTRKVQFNTSSKKK